MTTTVPSYLTSTKAADKPQLLFIENNGFFPNISLETFVKQYFVDDSFSSERQLAVLKLSILTVNDELANQVCYWQKKGYYSLDEVTQDEIELVYQISDDEGVSTEIRETVKELILAYSHAVFCKTMELLNERYRATDTKQYALPKVEAMEKSADNWEVEYRLTIYKLTGRRGRSVFVELI